MKTKKIDRIGFSLPSGITFWFTNDSNGIKEMIEMLNSYEEMNKKKCSMEMQRSMKGGAM